MSFLLLGMRTDRSEDQSLFRPIEKFELKLNSNQIFKWDRAKDSALPPLVLRQYTATSQVQLYVIVYAFLIQGCLISPL